jgi:sporulation protein YlmC with PRC-barrel domain
MKRTLLTRSTGFYIRLGLASPLLATEPPASGVANPSTSNKETAASVAQAEACLNDLRAFSEQIQKDSYWLGGSGYVYPTMGGFGFGYPLREGGGAADYQDARPGYNLRVLIAACNILAQGGQQQACANVLAAACNSYELYVADMPGWQQHQIDSAHPAGAKDTSFRSDQLVGREVRNPQNEALGSVDDVVMSLQADKIAYLIIAGGGFLGIADKYVAVPWPDFEITPSARLLVLDTAKSVMEASPLVSHDQFATPGRFDQESQKGDACRKTHLSNSAAKTNG